MSESHLYQAVNERFHALSKHELFVVDLGDVDLFQVYLSAFPEGTNPIFRVRTEHDCSTCRQFIKHLGAAVAIINGKIQTLWAGLDHLPYPYGLVAKALHNAVIGRPIKTVFRTKESKYGTFLNYDAKTDRKFDHFCGVVNLRHLCLGPGSARSEIESTVAVFKRGLEELTTEALTTVADLIASNALYRGEEHKAAVEEFRSVHALYHTQIAKDIFVWENYTNRAARFRNTVIGSLVVDLSAGMELEDAVKSFEAKVAPTNYKRPSALITKRMIEDAVKTLNNLGLEPALARRYAKLSDISVNNVLWVDNSVRGHMRGGLTDLLMSEVKPQTTNLENVEEISIDDFLVKVLPQVSNIDLLVENRHLGNFVSLTAPQGEAPRLFKWDNGFAWSYDGEVADSIKARVKKAGGNVDAELRVSLGWYNYDDLDIHVLTPAARHVYYRDKSGILDVDMNAQVGQTREAVENLAWPRGTLQNGLYKIWVNQFCKREPIDVGFALEVEYRGQLRHFHYPKGLAHREDVNCLTIKVEKGEVVSVTPAQGLVAKSPSIEKWGVNTETLASVDTVLLSPNHWDGQGVGNRHTFFILKNCKNPDGTRGIYNEFLRGDLDKHRKVFEILGAKTKCLPSDEQLSGVGFSSTRGDTVNVVVKGTINRAFKIRF